MADEMGQGKIPWYWHRLMHRKRVTCELHDSYFRLMTIKHTIPKIEWAIELLYNSVRDRKSVSWSERELEIRWVGDKMWQRKPPPGRRGLWDPRLSLETSWWEDAGMRTCPREARPPALWLSSSPGERERHTAMSGGAGEVNMLQSLFSLQLPLTVKPWVTLLYFFNEVFVRLYYCVIMYSAWICIWLYNNTKLTKLVQVRNFYSPFWV